MFLEEKKMFWEEAKPGKDEYQFIPSSQLQVCFYSQDNEQTKEAKVIGWNSFSYSVKNSLLGTNWKGANLGETNLSAIADIIHRWGVWDW